MAGAAAGWRGVGPYSAGDGHFDSQGVGEGGHGKCSGDSHGHATYDTACTQHMHTQHARQITRTACTHINTSTYHTHTDFPIRSTNVVLHSVCLTGGREMDVELKVSVVLRGDPAEASPGLTAVWAAVAKGLSGALPSKRGRADQSAGGDANGMVVWCFCCCCVCVCVLFGLCCMQTQMLWHHTH